MNDCTNYTVNVPNRNHRLELHPKCYKVNFIVSQYFIRAFNKIVLYYKIYNFLSPICKYFLRVVFLTFPGHKQQLLGNGFKLSPNL
jgi:hypothetical protein